MCVSETRHVFVGFKNDCRNRGAQCFPRPAKHLQFGTFYIDLDHTGSGQLAVRYERVESFHLTVQGSGARFTRDKRGMNSVIGNEQVRLASPVAQKRLVEL